MPVTNVCVYCASSPGNDPRYLADAEALGSALADAHLGLVYGGGDRGAMGAVARATAEAGGSVTGIIPTFLKELEQSRGTMGIDGVDIVEVPDMHTRKRMMFDHADAFIALPGGIGTLEELVEVLTWAQLGRHDKPVLLLNGTGFWTPYVALMDQMEVAGFLHNAERAKPIVCNTVGEAIAALQAA